MSIKLTTVLWCAGSTRSHWGAWPEFILVSWSEIYGICHEFIIQVWISVWKINYYCWFLLWYIFPWTDSGRIDQHKMDREWVANVSRRVLNLDPYDRPFNDPIQKPALCGLGFPSKIVDSKKHYWVAFVFCFTNWFLIPSLRSVQGWLGVLVFGHGP